ncbi:hypothetical protein HZA26_01120 [Candidatus Nomurabacteria bacterium]|nr:hypothetical protein [Candidatus Nomurabacteria bacterium]
MVGLSGKNGSGEKYFYYAHKKKSFVCHITRVKADDLHTLILKSFRNLVTNPNWFESLVNKAIQSGALQKPEKEVLLGELKSQIRDLSQQAENLLNILQNSPTDQKSKLMQERLSVLETHILRLEEQKRQLVEQIELVGSFSRSDFEDFHGF